MANDLTREHLETLLRDHFAAHAPGDVEITKIHDILLFRTDSTNAIAHVSYAFAPAHLGEEAKTAVEHEQRAFQLTCTEDRWYVTTMADAPRKLRSPWMKLLDELGNGLVLFGSRMGAAFALAFLLGLLALGATMGFVFVKPIVGLLGHQEHWHGVYTGYLRSKEHSSVLIPTSITVIPTDPIPGDFMVTLSGAQGPSPCVIELSVLASQPGQKQDTFGTLFLAPIPHRGQKADVTCTGKRSWALRKGKFEANSSSLQLFLDVAHGDESDDGDGPGTGSSSGATITRLSFYGTKFEGSSALDTLEPFLGAVERLVP